MGTIEIRRLFHAPPEELFQAWTEAERLRRWFLPSTDFRVLDVDAEARPGGCLRVELTSPAGRLTLAGKYKEVVPPNRLVLEATLQAESAPAAPPTRVTASFVAAAVGSELVLHQEGVDDERLRAEYKLAWIGCLARLPSALDESLERFFSCFASYPHFRSRFGGFWPDLSNASQRLKGKQQLGELDDEELERFRHWMEKGYVVLEEAVSRAAMDALHAEIDRAWQGELDPELAIEYFADGERHFSRIRPEHRHTPHKVLDLHGYSPATRDVISSPAIRRFLTKLFERPPMAFQSLLFAFGTEQDMHQDTAYVLVRSPMEFVGCWIALEDVQPGSGELQYYEGSHKIPEFLWFGRTRGKPYDYLVEDEFLRWVHEKPRELGCPLVKFAPKKGDALIWHADLVHGGAPVEVPGSTRHSLVTHFCPADVDPLWYGNSLHSEKLEHVPGSHYCYQVREDGAV